MNGCAAYLVRLGGVGACLPRRLVGRRICTARPSAAPPAPPAPAFFKDICGVPAGHAAPPSCSCFSTSVQRRRVSTTVYTARRVYTVYRYVTLGDGVVLEHVLERVVDVAEGGSVGRAPLPAAAHELVHGARAARRALHAVALHCSIIFTQYSAAIQDKSIVLLLRIVI